MRSLLLFLFLTGAATAAPVPPPPRLSGADLVGTWRQEWGALRGTMTIGADGSYACADDGGAVVYCGRWWLDGRTLILVERRVSLSTGDTSPANRYEVALSCVGPLRIAGAVRVSSSPFVLTEPIR